LQLTKQVEIAVAEAQKPITPPKAPHDDPGIAAFGQMVMAAMEKIPEADRLEIQCQVMDIFRNYKKKATESSASTSMTSTTPPDMSMPSPWMQSYQQWTPPMIHDYYGPPQQQHTPYGYSRWQTPAAAGRFQQPPLYPPTSSAQISPIPIPFPSLSTQGDTTLTHKTATTTSPTVTTGTSMAITTPITMSVATRQQPQLPLPDFSPVNTPIMQVRSPSMTQVPEEVEVTTTTSTPTSSVMSLEDFV
jgi:hypothetical protein